MEIKKPLAKPASLDLKWRSASPNAAAEQIERCLKAKLRILEVPFSSIFVDLFSWTLKPAVVNSHADAEQLLVCDEWAKTSCQMHWGWKMTKHGLLIFRRKQEQECASVQLIWNGLGPYVERWQFMCLLLEKHGHSESCDQVSQVPSDFIDTWMHFVKG